MLRFLSDQELSKSSAICRHRRSPLWLLFRTDKSSSPEIADPQLINLQLRACLRTSRS